ncbi:hypothetical protein AN618_24400 [Fervidicola ferrireducens]|uniref:Formylmethanofuran dehydrogenase subunit E domain-containing protein n=1 Tax=Fervidicola ferrireducens TaxID=520764 RepID=A0A140L075_9FIRM|nr:FmdE family protein [Fervidicola ferrireducens]KXG73950.1 hypothetical protein AN618_24400 [Fervidicola ferrireducens]
MEILDKDEWKKCVEFHGHVCPGLAIGYRACEALREKLGRGFSKDEELVCVTENDACGVDAVQVLTGCTFGKGNLIYRGTGKMAFSFFRRDTGESIRIVFSPKENIQDKQKKLEFILTAPLEDIFLFKKPSFSIPEKARIFKTVICEVCKEGAPEHKIRLMDGKRVCLDCFVEVNFPYTKLNNL